MGNEKKTVSREEAIDLLAKRDVHRLNREERSEDLFCMSVEDWEEDANWQNLDPSLRREITAGEIKDPEHVRFDAALLLTRLGNYCGATNIHLRDQLKTLGHTYDAVEGDIEPLESCPCCGKKTIGERGEYEICTVCWWEDDGQDNEHASEVFGGPNSDISLTQARTNFFQFGIYDPSRNDLRKIQEPAEKYQTGRVFVLNEATNVISEPDAGWFARVRKSKSE